jgi:hypothetical protein
VRWFLFAACVFGLSSSGCFNPKIKPGGFACSTSDPIPCPSGFFCVNGLCQDTPGGSGGAGGVGGNGGPDMAVTVAGDMSTAPSAGRDMMPTSAPPDLTQSVQDMAQPPPDMLKCSAPGAGCIFSSSCCSNSCTFFTCD